MRPPTDPAAILPLLEAHRLRGGRRLPHDRAALSLGAGRLLCRSRISSATPPCIQRRFDAEDWLRLVEKYRVTTTFSAPTPIRLVCNLPVEVKARYDRSSMKRMIANAAPWSFALKERYLADFPEDSLWEVYGSTELGVDTVLAPADQRRKPGSCGRPAPGVEISSSTRRAARSPSPDVPGEVFVRSAEQLRRATTRRRTSSRRAGAASFLSVGDIAYRDEEGFYYICDRKSDMIISGGMNVYPAEIEAALERHPDVQEVAVFGIPSDEWGESVHAVVVPRPAHTVTADDADGVRPRPSRRGTRCRAPCRSPTSCRRRAPASS